MFWEFCPIRSQRHHCFTSTCYNFRILMHHSLSSHFFTSRHLICMNVFVLFKHFLVYVNFRGIYYIVKIAVRYKFFLLAGQILPVFFQWSQTCSLCETYGSLYQQSKLYILCLCMCIQFSFHFLFCLLGLYFYTCSRILFMKALQRIFFSYNAGYQI